MELNTASNVSVRFRTRYTHRVAISNSRLIAMDERGVTFKWKDYRVKEGAKGGEIGRAHV